MLVPCAQLKLFAPLTSFPPGERARWASYVEDGGGLSRRETDEVERAASSGLLLGHAPRGGDAALVRRAGARVLVCPLRLDVRAGFALQAFRRRVPTEAFDAFVPDATWLTRLDAAVEDDRVPHVLDEPWAVPLPWFVAFGPDERRFRDPPEGRGPRISYLTTADQAKLRLERVLDVVEASIEDADGIVDALVGLTGWLEWFDGSSVLELDYGRVATLFPRDVLATDRTCEQLWEAVDALAEGDALTAAAAYAEVRARWATVRGREHAS